MHVFLELSIDPVYTHEGRRCLSLDQNVNTLGHGISVLTIILFYKYYSTKKYSYIILISFVTLFLTGSRTALVSSVLSILFIMYFVGNKKRIFVKYVFISSLVLSISFTVLINLNISGIARFVELLDWDNINQNTRFYTSTILFNDVIPNNLLGGIGLGNINSKEVLGYVPDADNMFVDILTQLGIFGLIIIYTLFVYALIKLTKNIKKHRKEAVVFILPLGLLAQEFFFSVGESTFDDLPFWLSIALCFIFLNSIKYEERSNSIDCSTKL